MKTLNRFYLISLIITVFISCTDDDPTPDPAPPEAVELEFTLETNQDQMGDFSDNAIVEYDGILYSVGGINSYSAPNINSDVWSSNNGKNWASITSGLFPPRSGATLTDYNGNMWLIGGRTRGGTTLDDIWYSPDGTVWDNLFDPAPFGDGFADHTTYIFGTKLFVYSVTAGIWSSSNGNDWNLENENPFAIRAGAQIVVLNDKAYCIGGYVVGSGYSNEVWSSIDGITWEPVSITADIFTPRAYHSATVYNDKIWVMGGRNGDTPLGEIWYSGNGSKWNRYDGAIPFTTIIDHTVLNYSDKMWLFGGKTETGISGKIYSIKEL